MRENNAPSDGRGCVETSRLIWREAWPSGARGTGAT
uniref:Uncharacterized protein n=1 Tax=Arundo donax TaxID=35708 RepID=A0A0A9BLA2_ARUDO